MSAVVSRVVAFVGSVEVHRVATAVAAVAVGLVGIVKTQGTDLGLDDATIQTLVGAFGVVIVAAREVASPVILPFILAIFKSQNPPV